MYCTIVDICRFQLPSFLLACQIITFQELVCLMWAKCCCHTVLYNTHQRCSHRHPLQATMSLVLCYYIHKYLFSFSALNLKEYEENLNKGSLGSGMEFDLQRTGYTDVASTCYTLDLLCLSGFSCFPMICLCTRALLQQLREKLTGMPSQVSINQPRDWII